MLFQHISNLGFVFLFELDLNEWRLTQLTLVYIIYSKKMEIYDFMQIGRGFLNIPFDVFMISVPQFFFLSLCEFTSHFFRFQE